MIYTTIFIKQQQQKKKKMKGNMVRLINETK